MVYSLSLLTTRAQCDAVLAVANEKLKVLSFRDIETDYRADNTSATARGLHGELDGLNKYIATMTPVLDTLDPGKERDEQANTLRRKTDRRDELLSRQGKVGGEKLLVQELEQALLEPQLPILQQFIADVTAHRATLSA
ncbi:hypothetical protein EJV47_14600 [Hymenobacter gummosus]|uniref:Uncharacterized protein n=1 Tax=Hymenobacter gummosus TaxID=1776032 RepID=A0A3S0QH65_9BACT|nr:hypothetical protein [Hymenobacter gummosus]RTQ48827.1 hypothetical protein EJV47_14600 [Hymenobacter gummosus]